MARSQVSESSFPGFKTSLQRGIPFLNVFDWLTARRRDENIGNYWRVHDKLYDLTSFIPSHPGGRDWLLFSRGLDVTEAFEASHVQVVDKVEAILAKYYVREADTVRNSPYTFKENGFYKTLKRRIAPIIEEIGTGYSAQVLWLQDSLVLAFILVSFLAVTTSSLGCRVMGGVLLGMVTVGGHNFLHKRDNWRQFYFDLSPLSSYEFRISHAFSHHLYPNTIVDFEVLLAEPLIKYLPVESKNFLQKYCAPFYGPFLFLSFSLTQLVCRCGRFIKGKQEIRPENLLIFLEFGIILVIAPSLKSGLISFLTIVMIGSLWVVYVGFAHHHTDNWHDGDDPRPDADFGLSQLDATKGKSDWFHKPLFVILTTFGEHPLHHLFPTVCHSKLTALQPIVRQVLAEFGEEFPIGSQFQLFLGSQLQMGRTSKNPWRSVENGNKERKFKQ